MLYYWSVTYCKMSQLCVCQLMIKDLLFFGAICTGNNVTSVYVAHASNPLNGTCNIQASRLALFIYVKEYCM
jgi:hypothetical protein